MNLEKSIIKNKIFDTSCLTFLKTNFFEGVKGIEVDLIDYPQNPYKEILTMSLSTWGSRINKWEILSPEEKFKIVKYTLDRKALPLGLESPSFLFTIFGVSRSSFDQIARQRIGCTFSSVGWNNIHFQTGIRIPREIGDNEDLVKIFKKNCHEIKDVYYMLIKSGISWQSARSILPMGLLHWFSFSINFMSLQTFCSRRLCFSEQEDTVATAWLMKEKVKEKFPFLSKYLRPTCDYAKKCLYQQENLPQEMGALYKSCERNKCENQKYDFNLPCSDRHRIMNDLNFYIPNSNEEWPEKSYNELSNIDKELFDAD